MNKTKFVLLIALILILSAGLRIYKLPQNPPGLYWEEVALGYDAYSIWKTGRDHHGNFLPLAAFKSFGDWKPSLYFYAAAPFVGLLGLNSWAVRIPSALAGIVIVVGVGQLTKFFWEEIKPQTSKLNSQTALLLGMLTAAITPWTLHFSRAAWESNLGAALILWGVICGLNFSRRHHFPQLLLSAILLILSMYAYHAMRIIAPLLGVGILLISFNKFGSFSQYVKQQGVKLLTLVLIVLILGAPLVLSLLNPESRIRFVQTNIFSDINIIELSNELRQEAGNTLISRFFHHRFWLFAQKIIANFLSHFSFGFLFVSGDYNPRHSIQYFGHLYYSQFLWLLLGTFVLAVRRTKKVYFLGFWLIITVMTAAVTKTVPHALRILAAAPVFLTVISLGVMYLHVKLSQLQQKFGNKWLTSIFWITFAMVSIFELSWYWHYFMKIYPVQYSADWQAAYPDFIRKVAALQQKYPHKQIIVTRELGRPAMYYWFYTQTDPKLVQEQAISAKKDQGEFLEFNNLIFDTSAFDKGDTVKFKLKEEK